ncbi:hypothetical protein [uncultured Neglectibacter sp.]|uniref:hypothetical protein n=1 Tax=uncultured Neglectibacter sp. TaxID=1924108 RepID=UPI0034DF6B76
MKPFLRKQIIVLVLLFCILILFTSCQKAKQNEKLRVLIDLDYDNYHDGNYRESLNRDLLFCFQYPCGLDTEKIQIEFLPTTESERNVKIQALKTEIMAGGGPDVFLLSCSVPGWKSNRYYGKYLGKNYDNPERLFPDVQAAMKNGIFLALDDYLSSAEWLDTDMLLSPARNAGVAENKLMIVPIALTFPVAIYAESAVENLPGSWSEAFAQQNVAVRSAYGAAAYQQFPDLFGQVADYEKNTLTVSKESLYQIVKESLAMEDKNLLKGVKNGAAFSQEEYGGFRSVHSLDYLQMVRWEQGYYDGFWEEKGFPQCVAPIYNTEGGVTAEITVYAGINRNTKYPETAFRILDYFSSVNAQAARGDIDKEGYTHQTFFAHGFYGVPARNDLMRNIEYSFGQYSIREAGDELFSEYTALRNEVTHARFYGTLDQELQTMYEACLEAESDEEIEKIVSKAYDTMLMILAES